MKNITPAELRSILTPQVHTSAGSAYFSGKNPDPALHGLFEDVAAAWAKFEEISEKGAVLREEHRAAVEVKNDHRDNPEAVAANVNGTMTYSDPEGVRRQRELQRIEKLMNANGNRAKVALLDYLVLAFTRSPEAQGHFLARSIEAGKDVELHAAALIDALTRREDYWDRAGQPHPGAAAASLPMLRQFRQTKQGDNLAALRRLVGEILAVPSLEEAN